MQLQVYEYLFPFPEQIILQIHLSDKSSYLSDAVTNTADSVVSDADLLGITNLLPFPIVDYLARSVIIQMSCWKLL